MTNKRKKRLSSIVLLLSFVILAVFFGLKAFNENLLYFYSPSDTLIKKVLDNQTIRLGGMVVDGSFSQQDLHKVFQLTDFKHTIQVKYTGILPDLFREGQGIIATGMLKDGVFFASEVLAKHDEKYMPPEVADALKKQGKLQ